MSKPREADCVFIDNPVDLRARVPVTGSGPLDEAAIARAESALKKLAVNFDDWMHDEIAALSALRNRLEAEGPTPAICAALFQRAHDIKGEAATLGFPIAGRIAGSLASLLEDGERPAGLPATIIAHHVDAIRAVVIEKAGGDDPTALKLAEEFETLARSQRDDHAAPATSEPVNDN